MEVDTSASQQDLKGPNYFPLNSDNNYNVLHRAQFTLIS